MRQAQQARGAPPRYDRARAAAHRGRARGAGGGGPPPPLAPPPAGRRARLRRPGPGRRGAARATSATRCVRREDGSADLPVRLGGRRCSSSASAMSSAARTMSPTPALQLAMAEALGGAGPGLRPSAADRRRRRRQALQAAGCLALRSLREQGIEPSGDRRQSWRPSAPARRRTRRRPRRSSCADFELAAFGQRGTQARPRRPAALLRRRAAPPAVRGGGARLRGEGLGEIDARFWEADPRQPRQARGGPRLVGGLPRAAAARSSRPRACCSPRPPTFCRGSRSAGPRRLDRAPGQGAPAARARRCSSRCGWR